MSHVNELKKLHQKATKTAGENSLNYYCLLIEFVGRYNMNLSDQAKDLQILCQRMNSILRK